MGRKQINLEFYDKKYIIEYNRSSVLEVVGIKEENDLDKIVGLVKAGLKMHHENDMPSNDEVKGWLIALGDNVKDFAEALQEMVQDVLETFKSDRKNLKWGKAEVEA